MAYRTGAGTELVSKTSALCSARHTGVRAAVDNAARVRDELPVVSRRMQGQFEDAEMAPVARFGSRVERAGDAVVLPAGPGDDLSDAVGISSAAWIELGEALVVVLVPVEHHVGVGRVEVVPERKDRGLRGRTGRKERVMEVRQRAGVRMRGQVAGEPGLLGA